VSYAEQLRWGLEYIRRTAETGTASTAPEPFGKPSGPGLWHHKGLQLPPYIQHVAHHLVAQGHDESKAIEMAVGIVRNWAEGHDGHGHKVHPDVQAAAAKNIAQWEADKARAGRARRSAVADSKKPYGDVKYADPKNGKYPIDNEAHCRAAWSYINMPKNAAMYPLNGVTLSEVKGRIKAALKKYGVDVSSDSSNGASRSELMRDYPLEDLHIVRSADGGDGRTMEAFAAVFNTETGIEDHEGRYLEVIEPAAFNKRLADLKRSRQGVGQVKVLFNHGRDLEGNLSERFMMPVAVPVSIEATPRGLLTRSRFVGTSNGDEVLELVKSGAVTAMSFTGRIIRSDPQLARRERHRPDSSGRLTTVRRMELGLREFGPVLFPAYEGAQINSVRMFTPGTWEPDEEYEALLPDGEAAPGEPPTPGEGAEHSARYHQHALYLLRAKEQREKAGLVW
jgi:HK97 family phage prohead protease